MIFTHGYKFLHVIYEDDNIWIAHAYAEHLSRIVVWKMTKDGPRALIENAKLIHEYEILKDLPIEGVLKPHSLIRQNGLVVLIFDIFHGIVLRNRLISESIGTKCFLEIAIRICKIVENLHEYNLVHLNIRPDTIIFRPNTLEVCLTGFSSAVNLKQMKSTVPFGGNPTYMAPERMTGTPMVDERTDLYSLGVTFYEMLARELPFEASNLLEWCHSHISKLPPSLSIKYGVPSVLADIVAKLLEKVPDDRYLSARGLRYDLEQCLLLLDPSGTIEPFELGKKDQLTVGNFQGHNMNSRMSASVFNLPMLPETVQIVGSNPIRQTGANFSIDDYRSLGFSVVHEVSQMFATEPIGVELIQKLIKLAVELIGAERGIWIDVKSEKFPIVHQVEVQEDGGYHQSYLSTPLVESNFFSSEIIQHVASLLHVVCIGNASTEEPFANTEYIRKKKPLSILCIPVLVENKLVGLFYLENNLLPYAFSLKSKELLNIVATKIYYAIHLQQSICKPEGSPSLTARESEVLNLVALGYSNKEIAKQLHVTVETVKSHVSNIFDKLNVTRRIQAVMEAKRLNLIR